jgi:hypothetical protein
MLCERHARNTTVVACEGTSDDMDTPCLEVRHLVLLIRLSFERSLCCLPKATQQLHLIAAVKVSLY